MGALTRRRLVVAAIVVMTSANEGATQDVSTGLFDEVARYVGAAVRFMAEAILSIESAEASQVAPGDRPKAIAELNGISIQLSKLTAAPGVVLSELSEYARRVRTQKFDPNRDEKSWQAVLSEFDAVSEVIKATLDVVENSKWLAVPLSVKERQDLREALFARNNLISRFKKMPAPQAMAELDQIDRMTGEYQKLLDVVRGMNRAVQTLTDRLAAK